MNWKVYKRPAIVGIVLAGILMAWYFGQLSYQFLWHRMPYGSLNVTKGIELRLACYAIGMRLGFAMLVFFPKHRTCILKVGNYTLRLDGADISMSGISVYKKTDTVFKFYKFFQANTEEEFNDFYENIKKLSVYDTGVTAEFGDHFITLSTCVYHVTNGRFVVVAKEIEPGETYIPIER